MQQLVYSVRYSVAPITFWLLNITYFSVRTTHVYNATKYSFPFMMMCMGLAVIIAMKAESMMTSCWEIQ
jgi:hypothetical protein